MGMAVTAISRFTKWGRASGIMLLAAIALSVAACTPVFQNHGYVPSDEELALVEVGKDTRQTVAATLGRPTSQGLLNDVGWFYVQSRWRNFGALPPKEVDRQVVAITFSEEGIVQTVERFGLEKGRVVAISRRVTESNIKGLGVLQQIFSNFGRIRADQILQ